MKNSARVSCAHLLKSPSTAEQSLFCKLVGACKGEHGSLCLRVQKVMDTGMGDLVVGFWLVVQK